MAFDFTDPRRFTARAALYALAFEEAGEALDGQRQLLADLRSRAAGVVATAALVASILGGSPAGDAHHGLAAYVAVAAFLGVGASALGLFWLGHLETTNNAEALIRKYAEPLVVPMPLVHRDLALHRTMSLIRNRRTLDRMTVLLRVAIAALATEVVAWVVNYAQTL
jgi:hypothetical protein